MRSALLTSVALACIASAAWAVEPVVLDEDTAAFHTLQGNVLLSERKYESAIEQYRRALALDARYFYAQFNLALANQSLSRFDEARRWYQEALRNQPDHHEVVCNLGFLAFRAGEFEEAARYFQDAANLAHTEPDDAADYWFNLGTTRERLGQWVEARRAYEGSLQIKANHYGAHYNLGTLFLRALAEEPDAPALAQAHLERARDIDKSRPEAWLNLAICHERAGRPNEAEAAYNQAIHTAQGPMLLTARWQQVRWQLRQVPPQKLAARDGLVAILADDPEFPEANGLLGQYYFQIGDYEQAVRYLELEIAGKHFDPGSPVDHECHYVLALIYTDHRPDARKATEHASAYYELHPDSPKIHALRRRAFRMGEAAATVAKPAESRPAVAPAAAAPGREPDPASAPAPAPVRELAPAPAHQPVPAPVHEAPAPGGSTPPADHGAHH